MTDVEREVREATRPALVKLTNDLDGLQKELLTGFADRRAVLDWLQRLTIRTLGELPDRWYFELAAQFRGIPSSGMERTLLSAMLKEEVRIREIDEENARRLRGRLCAITIRPAYHIAFRKLRKDAGEYIDIDSDSLADHNASLQRYIAMRPALDELERYQQTTVNQCLTGFNTPEEILEWGNHVELATHGEIPKAFIARCYRESSTSSLLCGTREDDERGRELFVAYHLTPYFNRGVRDLSGRSKEQPDAERPEREVPLA